MFPVGCPSPGQCGVDCSDLCTVLVGCRLSISRYDTIRFVTLPLFCPTRTKHLAALDNYRSAALGNIILVEGGKTLLFMTNKGITWSGKHECVYCIFCQIPVHLIPYTLSPWQAHIPMFRLWRRRRPYSLNPKQAHSPIVFLWRGVDLHDGLVSGYCVCMTQYGTPPTHIPLGFRV
jgi:hypothetical protein